MQQKHWILFLLLVNLFEMVNPSSPMLQSFYISQIVKLQIIPSEASKGDIKYSNCHLVATTDNATCSTSYTVHVIQAEQDALRTIPIWDALLHPILHHSKSLAKNAHKTVPDRAILFLFYFSRFPFSHLILTLSSKSQLIDWARWKIVWRSMEKLQTRGSS